MSLLPFAPWLASTSGSISLHESLFMYPVVESVDVLTLCVFVGMSVMLDLRLLGLVMKPVPVTDITRRLMPWMIGGFIIMVITGVLLFYAIPIRSYQSVWFRAKLILLVLAGLNARTLHVGIYQSVRNWDLAEVAPRRARVAGLASLILWAFIIVFGRMIAYNWLDCDTPQPAWVVWAAGCTADSP